MRHSERGFLLAMKQTDWKTPRIGKALKIQWEPMLMRVARRTLDPKVIFVGKISLLEESIRSSSASSGRITFSVKITQRDSRERERKSKGEREEARFLLFAIRCL